MIYDVIVIGAGQAGLSMGYYLNSTDLSFLILDKGKEVGEVWRKRYDSLTLFTPRFCSSLPGLTLDGNHNTYPAKDEIAEYLSSYAKRFSLPIKHNTYVQKLTQLKNEFEILTDQGVLTARNVVIATGPFQTPFFPEFSKVLSENTYQVHSSDYKNSMQLKDGSVLVVGGGNSGAQIAVELSKERKVYLSVGQKMKFLPQDFGNKSIFWWFDKLGILNVNVKSKVGKVLKKQRDPIFGFELKSLLKSGSISLKPRTTSIYKDNFIFNDGSELNVNNVIWSTGFKSDYCWINIPKLLNEKDFPLHERGITSINGLYFLGLPWQYHRGSALLQGVGKDAEYLFQQIVKDK
ncbi:putative oxidoreductase CzcO [Peribacillus frigoritolerans]|uniref:flavin-containing monooxygenase n=1 Tax=Peribacillus frigoritolerans TaxID=450367 RepID=UPI0030D5C491